MDSTFSEILKAFHFQREEFDEGNLAFVYSTRLLFGKGKWEFLIELKSFRSGKKWIDLGFRATEPSDIPFFLFPTLHVKSFYRAFGEDGVISFYFFELVLALGEDLNGPFEVVNPDGPNWELPVYDYPNYDYSTSEPPPTKACESPETTRV